MESHPPVCKFFPKCTNPHCRFYHPPNNQNAPNTAMEGDNQNMEDQTEMQPQSQNTVPNQHQKFVNCKFFQGKGCSKKNCPFFHGYGNKLKFIYQNSQCQEGQLRNLALMADGNNNSDIFITVDKNLFKFWKFNPNSNNFQQIEEHKIQIEGGEIGKLTYSNAKVIFSVMKEGVYENSFYIAIFGQKGEASCEAKGEIKDIFENGNIIVTVGKYIEVFKYNPDNNIITKTSELKENLDNLGDITCICLVKDKLLCGHSSGFLSGWMPGSDHFMTKEGEKSYHNGIIHKIVVKTVDKNSNYVMTCGEDGYLKLMNFEAGMTEKGSFKFESPVLDILNSLDSGIMINTNNNNNNENQRRDNFLVSLANGEIHCLDNGFKEVFVVKPPISQTRRFMVQVKNPLCNTNNNQDNGTYENYLIFSCGVGFDVYTWVPEFKEEQFKKENVSHLPHQPHYPHGRGNAPFNPRGGFRGGFRGGNFRGGNFRGGYGY